MVITGKARSNWYFEAQLEIELIKNGKTLARTIGKAQDNWMTNDYVDFTSTLRFPEVKKSGKAELLFRGTAIHQGKRNWRNRFKVPVIIGQ